MTKYESMLIARQDLGQSQVNDIVATLSDAIKKEGGEVVNVDNWGLKNLAYRIKKNRKGYYVVLNISAPANAIFEYERLARLNEDIIRYMTVKVDEFTSSKEEETPAAEPSSACSQAFSCSRESSPCSDGECLSWWPEPGTKAFLNELLPPRLVAGQRDGLRLLKRIPAGLQKGAGSSSLFVAAAF